MHYLVDNFKNITGQSPQMICMVPENISNTSAFEAENTFNPKTAYYKGLVTGVGRWKFDGVEMTSYPFAVAVNYNDGGQNDPIFSYCDEKIGNNIIGTGLLKKFYWQRLVIMVNGLPLILILKILILQIGTTAKGLILMDNYLK